MTDPTLSTGLVLVTSSAGNWTVVATAGELDAATVGQLRDHLLDVIAEGASRLVLDLSRVSFMDSTALGVLIAAHKRLRALDGALRIVISKPIVVEMLRLTALDKLFELHPTLEDALAAQ